MTGEYPILTVAELMVLLGVSGGSALYGFQVKPVNRREILQAAVHLSKRGLLTLEAEGFRVVDGELAGLLAPLQMPQEVVLLTPLAEEQPQAYFIFGDGAVGYESILVQPDAVRLFPLTKEGWPEELKRRGVLFETDVQLPGGYRQECEVRADFALPIQELAAQWRHVTALLEYRAGQETVKKVLLVDGVEDIRGIVVTKNRSWATNDALAAIGWAAQEGEE